MPKPPPTPQSVLQGLHIKILIDGKKYINGKVYGCETQGYIEEAKSIYDAVRYCADHAEKHNKEMEFPMAICILITPSKGGEG